MISNQKKILQEICASFNPVFVTKLYHGPAQEDAIANAWKRTHIKNLRFRSSIKHYLIKQKLISCKLPTADTVIERSNKCRFHSPFDKSTNGVCCGVGIDHV